MLIKLFNKSNKSFTIIELLVSISIIMIMSGLYFINYDAQKDLLNLRDAADIMVQKIRKTENLMMAYSEMPDCFVGLTPCNPLSGISEECVPSSYGIYFVKYNPLQDNSYFDIFADKNRDFERDLATEEECNCYDNFQQNECIERTFLPENIIIDEVEIDNGAGYVSYNYATANVLGEDLSVRIYSSGVDPNAALSLKITLCIISDCAKKRIITVNTEGMVDVQD